jgi:hypothetical protein
MAKTAAERKREQRERDKLEESERLARLLSRRIKIDLYKATDDHLKAALERAELDEPEDLITRLIHNLGQLDDAAFARITSLSRGHVTCKITP